MFTVFKGIVIAASLQETAASFKSPKRLDDLWQVQAKAGMLSVKSDGTVSADSGSGTWVTTEGFKSADCSGKMLMSSGVRMNVCIEKSDGSGSFFRTCDTGGSTADSYEYNTTDCTGTSTMETVSLDSCTASGDGYGVAGKCTSDSTPYTDVKGIQTLYYDAAGCGGDVTTYNVFASGGV